MSPVNSNLFPIIHELMSLDGLALLGWCVIRNTMLYHALRYGFLGPWSLKVYEQVIGTEPMYHKDSVNPRAGGLVNTFAHL